MMTEDERLMESSLNQFKREISPHEHVKILPFFPCSKSLDSECLLSILGSFL